MNFRKEGISYNGVCCVHSLMRVTYTCKANTVRGEIICLLTSKSSQQFAVETFKSAKDNVLNLSVHSAGAYTVMNWSLCCKQIGESYISIRPHWNNKAKKLLFCHRKHFTYFVFQPTPNTPCRSQGIIQAIKLHGPERAGFIMTM